MLDISRLKTFRALDVSRLFGHFETLLWTFRDFVLDFSRLSFGLFETFIWTFPRHSLSTSRNFFFWRIHLFYFQYLFSTLRDFFVLRWDVTSFSAQILNVLLTFRKSEHGFYGWVGVKILVPGPRGLNPP